MNDREKVIKGLECCANASGDECRKCPYNDECLNTDQPIGTAHLASNALALLKEQPQIVRCKDCKYCFVEGFVHEHNVCDKHEGIQGQPDDWFCADGERESDDA